MRFFLILSLLFSNCQNELPPASIPQKKAEEVGTKYYQWIDTSRADHYYGGQRMVNVQVWYPADLSDTSRQYPTGPYYYKLDEAYTSLRWSRRDLVESEQILTATRLDAPMANQDGGYPLILLSPSLGGNMSHYSYYAERLAAAGFVVAGVNHLYESQYVISPEQQVIPANLTFHDSLKTLDIPSEITADEYRAVKGIRQQVLGEDLLFTLNQLIQVNDSDFLGLIDTARVGTFGHSIGGAASVYAAYLDPRIKAVANLDGTPPSVALENGIQQAFLFIEDLTDYENHVGYAKMHQRRSDFCTNNASLSYRVLFAGTSHNSFLDFSYRVAKSEEEQREEEKVLDQTYHYLLTFFEHHLSDRNEAVFTPLKNDSMEIMVFP